MDQFKTIVIVIIFHVRTERNIQKSHCLCEYLFSYNICLFRCQFPSCLLLCPIFYFFLLHYPLVAGAAAVLPLSRMVAMNDSFRSGTERWCTDKLCVLKWGMVQPVMLCTTITYTHTHHIWTSILFRWFGGNIPGSPTKIWIWTTFISPAMKTFLLSK